MARELSTEESEQYSRQITLPEIGITGQLGLKNASVIVVGAGGLGCPVLQYLAAAGIGNIGIIDGDRVQRSNLPRQTLYSPTDIGKLKVDVVVRLLNQLNPESRCKPFPVYLDKDNAGVLVNNFDIVVDCSDNFETRYLLDDICVQLEKPLVSASVYRHEGQLSVFHLPEPNTGSKYSYRDAFPSPPGNGALLNCAESGVLGTFTGIIGTMQAHEVIKIITSPDKVLAGKLLVVNSTNNSYKTIALKHNTETQQKISINPPKNCETMHHEIKKITVDELHQWMKKNKKFVLIDVREPFEYKQFNLGGTLIPLQKVAQEYDQFNNDNPVVVYCKSGARSAHAIDFLQEQHNFSNLYNLSGGVMAWIQKFGSEVPG